MIDKKSTDYFYEQVKIILTSEIDNSTISNINKLYKEAIDIILANSEVDFSSYYSKLNYIIKSYSVPEELALDFLKLKAYLKKFNNHTISKSNVQKSINIFLSFITFFSNSTIPYSFSYNELPVELPLVREEYKFEKDRIDIYEAVVIRKHNNNIIVCRVDDREIKIKLDLAHWKTTYDLLWEYCSINLINIIKLSGQRNFYETDLNSAIIIEPNYLIDVTDLSACYNQRQAVPILYFTKKFNNIIPNMEIVLGNFVNSIFDEILTNPNQNFENIIDSCIRQKYLQVFSLVLKNKNVIKDIKQQLKSHIENLKKAIKKLEYDSISIEPTFISPKYGLQGRLDALLKFKDDENRKNIIELKSGNYPIEKTSMTFEDKDFYLNIWPNHLLQANCYDLLIDSTYQNRTGTTSILYSKDGNKPLRDATLTPFSVRNIINTRNQIIYLDRILRKKNFNLFYKHLKKAKGSTNNFVQDDLEKILNNFRNADKLTNWYFFEYLSLIQKEIYISKIGDSTNKGFSSLWLDSYAEKLDNFTALTNLELDHTASDFENYHLVFNSKDDLSNYNSLRIGDQIILYPMNDGNIEVFKNQILKATIKEINHKKVTISLRNKIPDNILLLENKSWIIEQDLSFSLLSKIISSVYQVYNLSKPKRDLIFGKLKPEFDKFTGKSYFGLNIAQNTAVNKALSAKNYFLIQGPPGTGKTSYVVKTIINEIYNNTNDNILILAYTNRAVDEIISAVKNIKNIKMIRFGSKESSEHTDILLSNLAENMDLNQLYLKLKQTRIFAATVASVLYNPEILNIVKFKVAIIDEASQILEPYLISIVNKVEKFILIGDEKQLPAIIRLDGKDTEVEQEELKSIGIEHFKISFFERLLNLCRKNNWDEAYILLDLQARMHKEIQDFPNKFFYDSKLKIMNENQKEPNSRYFKNCKNTFLSEILKNRIVFINTPKELLSKINTSEVKFVKKFIDDFFKEYDHIFDNTIGVISPFRAQCSEILKNLSENQKQYVICDTVERFQGSEREIIIISMATNYEYLIKSIQSIAIIRDQIVDRKLNVALTRAKEHIIILGNTEVLKYSDIYKELINYLTQKNKYHELDDLLV